MTSMRIDASEVHGFGADLTKMAGATGARVAAVIKKTAFDIERDAKDLAPVDTGVLKGSITSTITGDGRFGKIEAEVGPTAEYGIYQELGTSRMPAQAFLGPAFDRRIPGMLTALAAVGGEIIR